MTAYRPSIALVIWNKYAWDGHGGGHSCIAHLTNLTNRSGLERSAENEHSFVNSFASLTRGRIEKAKHVQFKNRIG